MEWQRGRRRVRPTALGLVELPDPLEHVLSRQPLELVAVGRDLLCERVGLAIDRLRQAALRVAPCLERGLDRLSPCHGIGPNFLGLGSEETDERPLDGFGLRLLTTQYALPSALQPADRTVRCVGSPR